MPGDLPTVLVVGPTGSGKTSLLKTINSYLDSNVNAAHFETEKERILSSVCPSVGTDFVTVRVPAKLLFGNQKWSPAFRLCSNVSGEDIDRIQSKRTLPDYLNVTLREVGGSLQSIWYRYFADANAICVVVDASNTLSVCGGAAFSFTTIAEILSHESLRHLPVAILLNKVDDASQAAEVASVADMLFSLDQLLKARSCDSLFNASIVTSSKSGAGILDFARWLCCL